MNFPEEHMFITGTPLTGAVLDGAVASAFVDVGGFPASTAEGGENPSEQAFRTAFLKRIKPAVAQASLKREGRRKGLFDDLSSQRLDRSEPPREGTFLLRTINSNCWMPVAVESWDICSVS